MGRKKKTVITEDTTVKGNQYINYQGNISVSIVKNKKVLSTKTYHNSGMPNLFRFLANCLGGNKTESIRPVKIKLFKYSAAADSAESSPANFYWDDAWEATNTPEDISPYILYNTTPVIKKITVDNEGQASSHSEDYAYEVTFHFTVPAAYIASDRIDLIALYPNNASNFKNDVSAYYLFTNEAGTEWDPLELSDVASGDFNLFLEWTLRISNKTN